MKKLLYFMLALMLPACGPAPGFTDSPYGHWRTEQGQDLYVLRNDTYRFCDLGKCETGKVQPDGPGYVLLLGFDHLAVTQRMIVESERITSTEIACKNLKIMNESDVGYTLIKDKCERPHFDFHPENFSYEKMGPLWKYTRCSNRPCEVVGDQKNEWVILVKQEEY